MMKNLIVSLEKLPSEVMDALTMAYPHGFDSETFDFRMPTRNEVYSALRFTLSEINYVIKIEKKKMDHPDSPGLS
jgi:hypothetical protein